MNAHPISFAYGRKVVLDTLELVLPTSGVVALTGPNGVGKTTLLKVLGRVLPNAHGDFSDGLRRVYFDAEMLTLDYLTVAETMRFFAVGRSAGGPPWPLIPEDLERQVVRDLSLGQRQRVALQVASLSTADVILLDEPFNGIDREGRAVARSILRDVAADAVVLYATHDAHDLLSFADYVVSLLGPGQTSTVPRAQWVSSG
ncbi:MAG: ABC transporter ATP-binding protein [Candidatus Nanopelagicales bacterium]